MASSSTPLGTPSSGPFPSYEESFSRQAYPLLSAPAKRLYWTLLGPLGAASVFVLDKPAAVDGGGREPYFRQTTPVGPATWHPVAREALTDIHISSVGVEVDSLRTWGDQWLEFHRHAGPGVPGCVYGVYDGDPDELVRCCGEDRPPAYAPLEVRATGGPGDPYITVHDYVSAVHPWIMGLKADIIKSLNMLEDPPFTEATRLVVSFSTPNMVAVMEEQAFLRSCRDASNLDRRMTLEEYFRGMYSHLPDGGEAIVHRWKQGILDYQSSTSGQGS
jgi:hypothetical protein